MSTKRRRANGRNLHLTVAAVNGSGAGNLVKSNDPVAVGTIPGVALTDEDADGKATVDTGGVYALEVNPAADMAEGDEVFWDNAAGELNDDNTGVFFGNVLEPVALAGAPHEVEVRIGR